MDWVNAMHKTNNKFKFQLFGRAIDNLDRLYVKVQQYDPEGSGGMSAQAFNLFLNGGSVFLSTQQIRSITDAYPINGSSIDYAGFINRVRKDITSKRLAVIDHSFEELSLEERVITIEGLLGRFKAKEHPHVRSLSKSAEAVAADFQAAIRRRSADKVHLNEEEFKEYCLDVNACVPLEREEFFVDIFVNCFGLLDNRVTLQRLKQIEVTIYEKVRQRTYFKKDEGLKSHNSFAFFDMEDKGVVDFARFTRTLDSLGCKFLPKELRALYQKHSDNAEVMTYQQFCGLLFEMGSGNKDNQNVVFQLAKKSGGCVTTNGMTRQLS